MLYLILSPSIHDNHWNVDSLLSHRVFQDQQLCFND